MLFFLFLDPNGIFLGSMWGSKTVLGSTNVVEQLSISMFPSILTFELDLILKSFFTFWGPNWLFFGVGVGFRHCFEVHLCS